MERDDSVTTDSCVGYGFVCAAAVGALGLFGNSVLQLIASKLLADRAELELVLPEPWGTKYGTYFPAVARLRTLPAEEAYALPLVADRVVLSHAGWRTWALRHPTGCQLAARLQAARGPGSRADRDCVAGSLDAYSQAGEGSSIHPGTGAGNCGPSSCQCDNVTRPAGATGSDEKGSSPPPPAAQSPALSGRQLRAHFPQVCGDDLHAEPASLRARLAGRGLWGWFQFPTSRYRQHRPAVRRLLALRTDLRGALEGALEAVLAAHPPATSTHTGVVGTSPMAGHSAAARTVMLDRLAAGCGQDQAGAGMAGSTGGADVGDCGGCLESKHGPAGGAGHRERRRLVVLHLRRGDFRDLLADQPGTTSTATAPEHVSAAAGPLAARAGIGAEDAPVEAQHPSHHLPASHMEDGASGRQDTHCSGGESEPAGPLPPAPRLRDSPPFEVDGQQGHAWRDKSGVDFRVPLEWYGAALADLPYDPARDLLWVCSDDAALAARPEVCGRQGTSWAAAAAALVPPSPEKQGAQLGRSQGDRQTQGGVSSTCGTESAAAGTGCDGSRLSGAFQRFLGLGDNAHPAYVGAKAVAAALAKEQDGHSGRCSEGAAPSALNADAEAGQEAGTRLRALQRSGQGPAHRPPLTPRQPTSPNVSTSSPPPSPPSPVPSPVPSPLLSGEQRQLLSQHALLADWFVMQRADVLLTSNSTLSFTAAMLNDVEGARLLRPDPALRALRRFDPWAELPLLPSAPVAANHWVNAGKRDGR